MDLALSDEQRRIVEMVRRFVAQEIVPLEDDLDPDADELPPDSGHIVKSRRNTPTAPTASGRPT